EIDAEGAVVEVDRPDPGELVVDKDHLLVQEPARIARDLDAVIDHAARMGKAGEPHHHVVRPVRNENLDVDAAHGRRVERDLHVHVRHEIGADDPEPVLGPGYDLGEGDGAFLKLVGRPGRHHEYGLVTRCRNW